MLLSVVFLASALSLTSAPVGPTASADLPVSSVWQAGGVVGPSGEIRGLAGWSVRLGLDGRAHLVGPRPRVAQANGPWEDTAEVGSVRLVVRTVSRDALAVYVAGRLSRSGVHRSFLLRWDAATGAWMEASQTV
ncbi:MAG: hypothetical protein AAF791_14780 [Bacteroidota bacterium]